MKPERRMMEEVGGVGNEALHGWAKRKVEEHEVAVRGQGAGVKRNGKKNSAGTRHLAR
jgi:hypothetical protein